MRAAQRAEGADSFSAAYRCPLTGVRLATSAKYSQVLRQKADDRTIRSDTNRQSLITCWACKWGEIAIVPTKLSPA